MAAASAHFSAGMSEAEICKVQGIELPVWQGTNEKWTEKLGDMMTENMDVATQYGDIYANPKVGKFATGNTGILSLDDVLKIVPDYDAYQKIFYQQSIASEYAIDVVPIIEEYGLDLQSWGQLNMHYMKWYDNYLNRELVETSPEEYTKRVEETNAIRIKWETHWSAYYKENAVNLSDDIDF